MRFEVAACPKCGADAAYVVESMVVHFSLAEGDPGVFDYNGYSEEFVETAEPDRDEHDRITLGCPQGHEWPSAMTLESP